MPATKQIPQMMHVTNHEATAYDIIGDIHGHVEPLRELLGVLGYRETSGSYQHPERRKVVFLGDFIDRGPAIRETLHLVRSMMDADQAVSVMGNHEFNAVCFHTPDKDGGYLRSHTEGGGKNVHQHQATLDAFAGREDEWTDWLSWFRQLPFFLDLGGLRAVHATWDSAMISHLEGKSLVDAEFLESSATKGSPDFVAVETVLKGIEIQLPDGHFFDDKQGFKRPDIRVRWWENPHGKTYRQAVFPDCEAVPDIVIDPEGSPSWGTYAPSEPPVFFGHYWLPAHLTPKPVSPNAACLDYSVAKPGGKLVAYRWDGEDRLDKGKFVEVRA